MPNHGQGGRPSKVDQYKDEILNLYNTQHWKQDEIVTWLADNKDLKIDVRTLQRRLKEWASQHHDRTEEFEIAMGSKVNASVAPTSLRRMKWIHRSPPPSSKPKKEESTP